MYDQKYSFICTAIQIGKVRLYQKMRTDLFTTLDQWVHEVFRNEALTTISRSLAEAKDLVRILEEVHKEREPLGEKLADHISWL